LWCASRRVVYADEWLGAVEIVLSSIIGWRVTCSLQTDGLNRGKETSKTRRKSICEFISADGQDRAGQGRAGSRVGRAEVGPRWASVRWADGQMAGNDGVTTASGCPCHADQPKFLVT
jgi:hypothetical protein